MPRDWVKSPYTRLSNPILSFQITHSLMNLFIEHQLMPGTVHGAKKSRANKTDKILPSSLIILINPDIQGRGED